MKLDPLVEEVVAATIACSGLAALIAVLYWLFTGLSPWPMVVLGELAGFGLGVAILALSAPRRRR